MTNADAAAAERLAARIIAARRGAAPLDPAEFSHYPDDIESAYAVQRIVASAVGPVGGFKTARKPSQSQIIAPIFAQDIFHSPATIPAGRCRFLGVELELGFLIRRPLPANAATLPADELRGFVSLAPAIEIVDTRLKDPGVDNALLKLADNQINGGLVIGTPLDDWYNVDTIHPRARLTFDTNAVLDGEAMVPGGDAFETFCALVGIIGSHCGGLHAGQFVITGSLNGLPYVQPGTRVRGSIAGLGDIAVDFST